MGSRAGFNSDQPRLQFGEEHLDLRTGKLPAEGLPAISGRAISMKDVLCDIETNCDRLDHRIFLYVFTENLIGSTAVDGCRPRE